MTDFDTYLPPLIVRRDESIDVAEAMWLTGLSDKHVRRVFEKFKLGAKMGKNSPLRIHRIGLMMAHAGDFAALELLRSGDRDHPLVKRFYVEFGYVYFRPARKKVCGPVPTPEWRLRSSLTPSEVKSLEDA